MGAAQEVVDRLDRVKGVDGHLDKDGIPVAHRAIPQAWQLQRLDVDAILTLDADKARLGIHKLTQIKLDTLVVLDVAHEVNRIEMGTATHHLNGRLVIGIDLG